MPRIRTRQWFQGVVVGKQPELSGDVEEDQPPYDPMSVVFTMDASPRSRRMGTRRRPGDRSPVPRTLR
jgi:hypothetical protein